MHVIYENILGRNTSLIQYCIPEHDLYQKYTSPAAQVCNLLLMKNAFVCRMSQEDVIMVWVTLKLKIRNNEVWNPSGMSDNKFLEFAEFCRKRYDWCQTRCVD